MSRRPDPPPDHFGMVVTIRDETGAVKTDADAVVRFYSDSNAATAGQYDPDSVRYHWAFPPTENGQGAKMRVSADGYQTYQSGFVMHGDNPEIAFDDGGGEVHLQLIPPPVVPDAGHVDPGVYSLDQLARIRGAMWTQRINIPFGHRPNADDNINAFAFLEVYDPDTRKRMYEKYKSVGYTHVVIGPVTGNDRYHGEYPGWTGYPTQEYWDSYLDIIQELWDNGLVPIYFCHPDGWSLPDQSGDMDQLDAFYLQPRAQKLLRVVVYSGWEPSGDKYGWANSQWVAWAERGSRVFPSALRGVHFPMDLDAPTGQNDDQTFPPGEGNIESWKNIAPYIHFFLDQVGGYVQSGNPVPTDTFKSELAKHIQRQVNGFRYGEGGWPTFSAWGADRGITYILSEYAAYGDYWQNWPESPYALDLGDIAITNGAAGYLDGGRLPIPSGAQALGVEERAALQIVDILRALWRAKHPSC